MHACIKAFFKWGRGIYKKDHTILCMEKSQIVVNDTKFSVMSYVTVRRSWSILSLKIFVYFHPWNSISCVFWNRFLDIQRLNYIVERLNLQLSTCKLCKYHNPVANLFSIAFQILIISIAFQILKNYGIYNTMFSIFKKTLNHLKIKDRT